MEKRESVHKGTQPDQAVDGAIRDYIQSRRAMVPAFVKEHFSFKGALRLNKKGVGHDLLKAPLNVAWALPYASLIAFSYIMKKAGLKTIPSKIGGIPPGFKTEIQKEINWLIFTELLELPFTQGERTSKKDALFEAIIDQPEISSLFIDGLSRIHSRSRDPKFRLKLEKNLQEYSKSRTAAAELAGSIISLSAGAGVLGKMTPGAITVGGGLAAAIGQHTAISNFFLGPTLGSIYYGVFPASVSMGLVIASTGTVMAALAVLTCFSGMITDPLQVKLGLHQRRLDKLIDCIEKELRGFGDSKLKIKEHYVARIVDLIDLFKRVV